MSSALLALRCSAEGIEGMEGMELPSLGTHNCRSWGFKHSEDYVPAPRGFPGLSDITFASEALAAPRALG
ncbi:hypothetical protein, partial [Actinomyces massiliensis]|uniref:hypothetical protein n=1 Tax=Actinomyces massiliensis TaxID=461393 RepID=UPI001E648B7B